MRFSFGILEFSVEDGRISMTGCGTLRTPCRFVQVQISGGHRDSHEGIKMGVSSEGPQLQYVRHEICGDRLVIVQRTPAVEVTSTFLKYPDTCAVRTWTTVKNMESQPVILEEVSSFMAVGLGNVRDAADIYLYRFYQGHHTECQPRRLSLRDLGMIRLAGIGSKRVYACNVGSWSTKEELPQGIVEHDGSFTMFQIESSHDWYYEISDRDMELYLYLSGGNRCFGDWKKVLQPGKCYETVPVAIACSDSLNGVLGEMTGYRRHIRAVCPADDDLPVIFNEYMHLSWDSPTEKMTGEYAPVVADMGARYYVIDCGWHDEEPGNQIYPYVGRWKESKARFPHGLRKTTDQIRALGMKPGLWIEPEIVGMHCREMLAYYDDDCFIRRDGKRVCVMGRYFLDYRAPRVRSYMTETICRMVEQYGAEYIKMDYNQDLGIGTDADSDSCGEGLEQCNRAFLSWVDEQRERYPNVLFEACASGGHRMDYGTLTHFPIVSTSDQTDYRLYPCIAGNILSAVLPEQAAVWSYPVAIHGDTGQTFASEYEKINHYVSEEQVVMNMVNSLLGRMHLASYLGLLSEEKKALVREGVSLSEKLSPVKKRAVPYLPLGFCNFGDPFVASGMRDGDTVYLAVWNLDAPGERTVTLDAEPAEARILYPESRKLPCRITGNQLHITFTQENQARFLKIRLK